ncbi:hypothetical protein THF1D04_30086 [Vibrio owensii]|uniref:Uncharacterized protein n=1 Tax=Vibrio owensii TaxID=696485 RepID=A0AAU9Q664_9VIBR|nr:hypothetical protein THF1D04_30086 [Vibrio owensii]
MSCAQATQLRAKQARKLATKSKTPTAQIALTTTLNPYLPLKHVVLRGSNQVINELKQGYKDEKDTNHSCSSPNNNDCVCPNGSFKHGPREHGS